MKKLFIIYFLTVCVLSQLVSCDFAPGSYAYAEEYEINANENDLIEVINDFKKDNPEYVVPEQSQLVDGRNKEVGQDFWYHIYFYYKAENRIVKCWTRPINKKKTTFAIIGINQGLTLGNWKMINKDFNNTDNEKEKKRFQEEILR